MKESTTYQATVEEGLVKGLVIKARQILRRLGSKRFGAPSEAVSGKLDAIASEQTLDTLTDRVHEVASWEELLEPPAPPSKRRKPKS